MTTAALFALATTLTVALPHDAPHAHETDHHAQPTPEVRIVPTRVARNVYMLTGQGGNIGLTVGNDGAFMIDDQFAPLTAQILETVRTITPQPVKFVINTHWHFDHTGGNENLGKAGAIIVAHENVRTRMSTDQFIEAFNREVPAAPAIALPVITFRDAVTFHWNDDELRVIHVPAAHTDGDAFVHFTKANVIHAGDVFFNGMYPFIDVGAGGSASGMIEAIDVILSHARPDTKIIPGHGPLGDVESFREFRAMLVTVRDRVGALLDHMQSREMVIAAKPTADFDAAWGKGFLAADQWVGIVFDGETRRRAEAAAGAATTTAPTTGR